MTRLDEILIRCVDIKRSTNEIIWAGSTLTSLGFYSLSQDNSMQDYCLGGIISTTLASYLSYLGKQNFKESFKEVDKLQKRIIGVCEDKIGLSNLKTHLVAYNVPWVVDQAYKLF